MPFQWVRDLQEFYNWADSISDQRTAKWLFVPSILSPLMFVVIYLLVVWLLPKIMRSREPFQLTSLLVIYNAAMTVLNLYICIEVFISSTDAGYSYFCQELDMSYNPKEFRIARVIWWFYFSKIMELLDTVFFLLRKKSNQVSFLHVYHHTSMVCLWWIGVKWVAGGQSFLSAMINSLVHVVMYTYYGMSAMPHLRKYLWWKKHLTQFQLIQFCILLCHGSVSLYVKCKYPLWMQYALIGYMISFLILFSNFYIHAYFSKTYKKHKVNNANWDITANGEAVTNGEVLANGLVSPREVEQKKRI